MKPDFFVINSSQKYGWPSHLKGCRFGIVANVMDCDTVGSEFAHESRVDVYFRTSTFGKGMNHPYSLCYGLNKTTNFL